MGDDQASSVPGGFAESLLEPDCADFPGKLAVAASRHCQDVFDELALCGGKPSDLFQFVQTQQAPVGYQHHRVLG